MSWRGLPRFLPYLAILAREVVLASIQVAKLVLGPEERLRSGFIAVPTEAATDLEIAVLANSITLTPGTITVHLAPESKTMIIHAIDIGRDPEDVRASIRTSLENNILRWTRPGWRPSHAKTERGS